MMDSLPVLMLCAVALLAIGIRIWRFERKAKRDNLDEFTPRRHPRWLHILAEYTVGRLYDAHSPPDGDVGPPLWRRRSHADDNPAGQRDDEHPSHRD